MIFVTVGTHEQPFDRLVKELDGLIESKAIAEEVYIQTGYCEYNPRNCRYSQFLSADEMAEMYRNARIIITHGGPSSFMAALEIGKIPIVVPRIKEFGEHVNNHQVDFANAMYNRYNSIIVVDDISKLSQVLADYDTIIKDMCPGTPGNNALFCESLNNEISKLFRSV